MPPKRKTLKLQDPKTTSVEESVLFALDKFKGESFKYAEDNYIYTDDMTKNVLELWEDSGKPYVAVYPKGGLSNEWILKGNPQRLHGESWDRAFAVSGARVNDQSLFVDNPDTVHVGTFNDLLAEFPHSREFSKIKSIEDVKEYANRVEIEKQLYGKDVYKTEGTIENTAHSQVEPGMKHWLLKEAGQLKAEPESKGSSSSSTKPNIKPKKRYKRY